MQINSSPLAIRSRVLISVFLIHLCLLPAAHFGQDTDDEEFTQYRPASEEPGSQSDPVELFNKGQEAHEQGDLETALEFYRKAIKAYPEFPEAEYQSAVILLETGKDVEAEAALRRAISYRRDWTLPMSALGALLVRKGNYAEAEELLNKALRIEPMTFPAYSALADLYLRTDASAEVLGPFLDKLTYLTTKARIPASIWSSKAAVERRLGKTEDAAASVSRALASDPDDLLAQAENVELMLARGDSEGAVQFAGALAEEHPGSVPVRVLFARSLYASGDSKGAIKALESIEEPDAETSSFLSELKARDEENIESLEKVLESDPENEAVLGRLCVLTRVIAPGKSLEYCQKALLLDRSNLGHATGIGAALVQLQRYPEAVNVFRQLLKIAPENYTVRANLATALFQMGSFQEAIPEYEWIVETKPDVGIAYYFLGICFDKVERYRDSLANYQKFLSIADPDVHSLEIEKVNLRLPVLSELVKEKR